MPPATFAGVLLFIWLITPGFLFSLLADRRCARAAESAFHETARTIVASVAFSALGAVVAAVVVAATPARLSLGQLVLDGRLYLGRHIGSAGLFLGVQIVVGCSLAFVADWFERRHITKVTKQDPPALSAESAWDKPLSQRPEGTSTHVWLRLASDIEFRGRLGAFGREIAAVERELVLVTPIEVRYPRQRWQSLGGWHRLVLQGGDIQFLAVTYPLDGGHDANSDPGASHGRGDGGGEAKES